MDIRVTGSVRLRTVAAEIKATGDKGLGKEMTAALRRAALPVQLAIRAEAEQAMPSRGGYRELFSKSLRFRTTVRSTARTGFVQVVTFADGTKERRDIGRLNQGQLRHPVYGRSRNSRRGRIPNPWAVTRIPADFFGRGTRNAMAAAEREMAGVLDDYAARLAGRG